MYRCGKEGFLANGVKDTDFLRNNIHDNNKNLAYNPGWEGGGGKIAASDHVTFSKNRVHHNGGVGHLVRRRFDPWPGQVQQGLQQHPRRHLLRGQPSAPIYGNKVWRNGHTGPAWGYGAGIQISSSDGARVHDNIVAWNARGISVISQERGPTPHNGNLVYENTIISATNEFVAGFYDDHGGSLWSTSNGNKGYDNRYWVGGARTSYQRFIWNGSRSTLGAYNATLGEQRGKYISRTTRNRILRAASMPTTP